MQPRGQGKKQRKSGAEEQGRSESSDGPCSPASLRHQQEGERVANRGEDSFGEQDEHGRVHGIGVSPEQRQNGPGSGDDGRIFPSGLSNRERLH